ncbi:hypothetical protein EYZ66_11530 [Aequoribacter fuscus]|uniref:glycosyltransferase n=1 Tax=Aequoribacter fuscus TaxID=2518989 RepID=UPI001111CEBE|nr:glycosyltransferase family 4 protein [Aequoribacter fuscus]QHJ88883.1 hypothetical protein EYZ66_11530 [Aequoribacter fuscus]
MQFFEGNLKCLFDFIIAIPNGWDISFFENYDKAWRPTGVNPDDLMEVFTSTHGMANVFLNSALELKKCKREVIKIILIGQGKMKPSLQKLTRCLGLDNVISHDPVDNKTLAGIMAGADIGLQLFANVPVFYYITSPNKFFDYIASELPVLNNYLGLFDDFIKHEQCGLLYYTRKSFSFC